MAETAIPTDDAPQTPIPTDDDTLRKLMAIPTGAEVRPTVASNRGIPVTPQTPHAIIPTNRATGQPEELNNQGKAIAPGVAGLWARAENIHNPILRTLGKIGAVGARAIDVASSVAAPGIAAAIPGSTLNQKVAENRADKQQTADTENAQREAGAEHEKAETEAIPAHTALEQAQTDVLNEKEPKPEDLNQQYADAVHAAVKAGKNPLEDPTVQKYADSITQLQKQPQQTQEKLDQQYNDAIKAGDHETAQRVLKVKHDLAVAGQAPQRPPQITMVVPGQNGGPSTVEALRPGQAVPSGAMSTTQYGAQSPEFDKAYVVPARQIEKSYQMMDEAYREYKAARAEGKELPTGAQSMLALSTHLTTTFGNVKGARITKDMIAEHLHARSIGDDALVAVQKLSNGDKLSPDQWDAFHQLVTQSRRLSWEAAAAEAHRKGLPINFLPPDAKVVE